MKKKLCVIYLPGLGDAHPAGQRFAVRLWKLWGVNAELFRLGWEDDEPWENKLRRLLVRIDALAAKGNAVALVGASAGASAAINAYAVRKSHIVGCVLIAGKVNRVEAVGERYRRENPAFVESVRACRKALASLDGPDRRRVLSRYSAADPVVSKADSHVAYARNQTIPTPGHSITIAAQLIFGAPSFLHFLKTAAKIKIQ